MLVTESFLRGGFPAASGPRASLDRVRDAALGMGLSLVNQKRDSFKMSCPAHSDPDPSLSVTWEQGERGGKTMLHCFAGCYTEDVLSALGLGWPDVFDEPLPPRERGAGRVGRSPAQRAAGTRRGKLGPLPARLTKQPQPKIDHQWVETKRYVYTDPDGRPVQAVIRQECTAEGARHKNFVQTFLTVDGQQVWEKPAGFARVLFRAPQVRAAVRDGQVVYLLEGEKDVETAEALGVVATTNTQGGASFPLELISELAGAHVVVVLDRDATGYARGVDLYDKLTAVGATVQLVLPATEEPKSDLTDHVEAGFALEDLIEVTVDQVAAWASVAKVEGKHRLVTEAEAEARARRELVEAENDVEENTQFARRWVLETEIRVEEMVELAATVASLAADAGTAWAGEAAVEADRLVREATELARRVHRDLGIPTPGSLLAKPAPAPQPKDGDEQLADDEDEGGSWPDSTTSVEDQPGPSEGQDSTGARASSSVFRVVNGRICQWTPEKGAKRSEDGQEGSSGQLKELLSMVVRVVAREYLEAEDDGEVEHIELLGRADPGRRKASTPRTLVAVRLQYQDPDSAELMEIRVMADQWRDHSWLESLPGSPDFDHRRAGLDVLQRAILAISRDAVDETLYRSTGWRRGPDGVHRYVHARGAITPHGHEVAEVSLSGPILRFDLPDPVSDPQVLRQAWLGCSAVMLDRFPGRIVAPLLGHVFRAVLGPNPWNLALIGSPGSYKTSLASKVMQHFGERWEHDKPLTSMSGNGATFNALRLTLHKAKDAIAWLDDFAPTKSWLDAQKLLEETSRLIHNRESRPRSSRDGQELMGGTAPRTSGLFTSEVMPRPGSSGGERMLVVPMLRDEIALADLKALDEPLSRHGRAVVMSSYISWLAGDLPGLRDRYLKVASEYADVLTVQEGESVRQASAIASTWAGWVAVCDFLTEIGAIDQDERTATLERVDEHLREAGKAAVDPDSPRTTGGRVRDLLGYALRQGIAYVDDVRTGDNPPWPLASRLGWRRTCVAEANEELNQPARYRLDRGGIKLGYVMHDPGPKERGRVLMCEPSQVEAVIKAAAGTQVEKLEIDWKTAARALYDEGILLGDTSEPGRVRLKLKCRIAAEGRDVRMAVLLLDKIIGEDPDHDDDLPGRAPEPGSGPQGDERPDGGQFTLPGLGTHVVDDDAIVTQGDGNDVNDHSGPGGSDEESMMFDLRILPDGATGVCVQCGNPARTALGDQPVHAPCWQELMNVGLPSAAAAAPAAPSAPPVAAAPPAAVQAAAPDPTPAQSVPSPQSGARGRRGPTKVQAKEFRAAAMVLDVDGMYLSNGERLSLPASAPQHVGNFVSMAWQLGLGTQTTDYLADSGQVWITEAMARQIGLDVDAILEARDTEKDEVAREVTASCPAVAGALAAGYKFGAESQGLGKWTRVWHPDDSNKAVWLVLVPALQSEAEGIGFMNDDPDAATLARRIGLFATELRHPYHLGAAATGLDLLFAVRRKDREKFFEVIEPVQPAQWANTESDLTWCRKPTAEELEHTYVHAYDRSGSYLAGVAGLDLGLGDPVHHPEGTTFDRHVPGYWRIAVPQDGDWRVPGTLNWNQKNAGTERWVTTPTLQFAFEQEYAPKILEAYTWNERARVLDPWYERIRDARAALDVDDPDFQAARDQLKMVYAMTIGMMGSEKHRAGKEGYRPDWRHHVVAKSRVAVERRIARIGAETDRWPVAVVTDTILYTSNEADPVKAWPGGEKWYGRGLGQYKHEGTALLADHLPYLAGGAYKGRDIIVPPRRGAE